MKDKLLESNIMKYLTINQYAHLFLTLGLSHPKACIYQFIGNDTKEKANILRISCFLDWDCALKYILMF